MPQYTVYTASAWHVFDFSNKQRAQQITKVKSVHQSASEKTITWKTIYNWHVNKRGARWVSRIHGFGRCLATQLAPKHSFLGFPLGLCTTAATSRHVVRCSKKIAKYLYIFFIPIIPSVLGNTRFVNKFVTGIDQDKLLSPFGHAMFVNFR